MGEMNVQQTENVLRRIFPNVITVSEYVSSITEGQVTLAKDSDEDLFLRFLDGILMVPEDNLKLVTSIQKDPAPIKEILHRLIAHIVRSHGTVSSASGDSRSMPVLALGYRLARWTSELSMRSDVDIECYYINTIHSYILSSHWQLIADRAGEAIVRRILLQRVFLATSNGCYVQISGLPVKDRVYMHKSTLSTSGSRTSGKTLIPRGSIMYNRKYNKSLGLPKSHVLRRKTFDPLHLLKEILPDLPAERYQSCEILCDKLIKLRERYLSVDFSYLLNAYCPLPQNERSSVAPKKRKRRGCRGGKAKQHKTEKNCSSESILLSRTHITEANAVHEKVLDNKNLPSILQRAIRNSEKDSKVIDDGICSQSRECYDAVGRIPDDFRVEEEELHRYEDTRALSERSIPSSLEGQQNVSSNGDDDHNVAPHTAGFSFAVTSPLNESLSADSGTNYYIQSKVFQSAGVIPLFTFSTCCFLLN